MPETLTSDVLPRLKETCVFISGPDGTGTGYLIAPQRIGTAHHVVKSWKAGQRFQVIMGVGGPTCQASLLNADPASDSAVLGFDEHLDVPPLPIGEGLRRHVAWEGFGFPASVTKSGTPSGLPIDGEVKDADGKNDMGQSAIVLFSEEAAAGQASPLHGFSGSPVVVDGALVGHLTKHIGDPDDKRRASYGYVYACPIDAVAKLLDRSPARKSIAPPPLPSRQQSIPPVAAQEYHVLVSYRSLDRPWAMSLVARLEGAGLSVFSDQNELERGEHLAMQLKSVLERSHAAVVLVSRGWLASPSCQEEAKVIKNRAVEDPAFRLIPLRLDDSPMPPYLVEPPWPGLNGTAQADWLDFNGMAQAEGEQLDQLLQLLSTVLGGKPLEAGTLAARVEAAESRVTDEFVAEIKEAGVARVTADFVDEMYAAARGDSQYILELVEQWRKTASTNVAPVITAAEILNGRGQFELALDVLRAEPDTLRVRQLRAFALRKLGKVDEGTRLLELLYREGELDSETGGLLAGSYKARWMSSGDRAFLQQSYQLYRETYERTGDTFNGINAAAMALQCGDRSAMRHFAAQVRDQLLKADVSHLDDWGLATLGEAELLMGWYDSARGWYAKAAGKAAGLYDHISVMRKQARLDLEALGQNGDRFDDVLPVPRPLVYFGHMVDAEGRPTPRLPPAKVGKLRNLVRDRIKGYGAVHGFGQAASGTDLIVLQELVERGLRATVVMPLPRVDFLELSAGGHWSAIFAQLHKDSRIEFTLPLRTQRPSNQDLPAAFREANMEVKRRVKEFARRFDVVPIVLAVWDGSESSGSGGTADAAALWQEEGLGLDIIDPTKI